MTATRSKHHPRYDADLRRRIKRLHRKHGSVRAVAKEIGMAHSRVWHLLREQGVDTSRKPPGRAGRRKGK